MLHLNKNFPLYKANCVYFLYNFSLSISGGLKYDIFYKFLIYASLNLKIITSHENNKGYSRLIHKKKVLTF